MKQSPDYKENLKAQKTLSTKYLSKIHDIEQLAVAKFIGNVDELESAIGMLHLGFYLGWRPLYLVHTKATIRKYEEILDIKVKELFEPEGPSSRRHRGYDLAKKASNFWKAVSGEIKIAHRRFFQEKPIKDS